MRKRVGFLAIAASWEEDSVWFCADEQFHGDPLIYRGPMSQNTTDNDVFKSSKFKLYAVTNPRKIMAQGEPVTIKT